METDSHSGSENQPAGTEGQGERQGKRENMENMDNTIINPTFSTAVLRSPLGCILQFSSLHDNLLNCPMSVGFVGLNLTQGNSF